SDEFLSGLETSDREAAGTGEPDSGEPGSPDLADEFLSGLDSDASPPTQKQLPDPGPGLYSDHVDADILGFFLQESSETLERLEQSLLVWERDAGDKQAAQTILRLAHTIKGAANSIGLARIGHLFHAVEDILEDFIEGRFSFDHQELVNVVFSV